MQVKTKIKGELESVWALFRKLVEAKGGSRSSRATRGKPSIDRLRDSIRSKSRELIRENAGLVLWLPPSSFSLPPTVFRPLLHAAKVAYCTAEGESQLARYEFDSTCRLLTAANGFRRDGNFELRFEPDDVAGVHATAKLFSESKRSQAESMLLRLAGTRLRVFCAPSRFKQILARIEELYPAESAARLLAKKIIPPTETERLFTRRFLHG